MSYLDSYERELLLKQLPYNGSLVKFRNRTGRHFRRGDLATVDLERPKYIQAGHKDSKPLLLVDRPSASGETAYAWLLRPWWEMR